jgi:hypothetical protein
MKCLAFWMASKYASKIELSVWSGCSPTCQVLLERRIWHLAVLCAVNLPPFFCIWYREPSVWVGQRLFWEDIGVKNSLKAASLVLGLLVANYQVFAKWR